MREGDRWKWCAPGRVRHKVIEVVGGKIIVIEGRGKGDVWSTTLDIFPDPHSWEYIGNFSKSDNFNSLYNKLNGKEL